MSEDNRFLQADYFSQNVAGEDAFRREYLRKFEPRVYERQPHWRVSEKELQDLQKRADERDKFGEEAERLRDEVKALRAENLAADAHMDFIQKEHDLLDEENAKLERDRATFFRMERDISLIRAYLGSKLFGEIVTGEVKAPEPPPEPKRFDWNEMRRVR